MRSVFFIILLMSAAHQISSCKRVIANQHSISKFQVTGSVMQTVSYCGGARPTQEMLDSFSVPKGLPFAKLFVLKSINSKGVKTIVDTIYTDESGNFSIALPAGNYCLVEEWKTKTFELLLNNENEKVDSVCLRKLYNACDYKLNITHKNVDNIKVIFHRSCFFNKPCIRYSGPLPPRPRQ